MHNGRQSLDLINQRTKAHHITALNSNLQHSTALYSTAQLNKSKPVEDWRQAYLNRSKLSAIHKFISQRNVSLPLLGAATNRSQRYCHYHNIFKVSLQLMDRTHGNQRWCHYHNIVIATAIVTATAVLLRIHLNPMRIASRQSQMGHVIATAIVTATAVLLRIHLNPMRIASRQSQMGHVIATPKPHAHRISSVSNGTCHSHSHSDCHSSAAPYPPKPHAHRISSVSNGTCHCHSHSDCHSSAAPYPPKPHAHRISSVSNGTCHSHSHSDCHSSAAPYPPKPHAHRISSVSNGTCHCHSHSDCHSSAAPCLPKPHAHRISSVSNGTCAQVELPQVPHTPWEVSPLLISLLNSRCAHFVPYHDQYGSHIARKHRSSNMEGDNWIQLYKVIEVRQTHISECFRAH